MKAMMLRLCVVIMVGLIVGSVIYNGLPLVSVCRQPSVRINTYYVIR